MDAAHVAPAMRHRSGKLLELVPVHEPAPQRRVDDAQAVGKVRPPQAVEHRLVGRRHSEAAHLLYVPVGVLRGEHGMTRDDARVRAAHQRGRGNVDAPDQVV